MSRRIHHMRWIHLFLTFLFLLFTTGCWDNRDIEDIALVVGVALDKYQATPAEETDAQSNRLITLTDQLVIPNQNTGAEGAGKGTTKPYENVSVSGKTILETARKISLHKPHSTFSQHLKVMVIGEDLVREISLQHLLNFFLRRWDIRLSSIVLIAKGRASDVLKSANANEIPAFQLNGIADNQDKQNQLLPSMSIGKISSKMASNSSFILQSVDIRNGKVQFDGGAVIRGNSKKLAGFLSKEEVDGLNWLTGKGRGGIVSVFDPDKHMAFVYEILTMKSDILPRMKGNNVAFEVHIQSTGRLNEDWMTQDDAFDPTFLKKVEIATENQVNQTIAKTLARIQKQYKADVAGFGDQLRIHYPRAWQKLKNKWDDQFKEVPIHYDVNIQITDFGQKAKSK